MNYTLELTVYLSISCFFSCASKRDWFNGLQVFLFTFMAFCPAKVSLVLFKLDVMSHSSVEQWKVKVRSWYSYLISVPLSSFWKDFLVKSFPLAVSPRMTYGVYASWNLIYRNACFPSYVQLNFEKSIKAFLVWQS